MKYHIGDCTYDFILIIDNNIKYKQFSYFIKNNDRIYYNIYSKCMLYMGSWNGIDRSLYE